MTDTPKTNATAVQVANVAAALKGVKSQTGQTVEASNTTAHAVSGPDSNTGPSWGSGERNYINNLITSVNQLISDHNVLVEKHNFMRQTLIDAGIL